MLTIGNTMDDNQATDILIFKFEPDNVIDSLRLFEWLHGLASLEIKQKDEDGTFSSTTIVREKPKKLKVVIHH